MPIIKKGIFLAAVLAIVSLCVTYEYPALRFHGDGRFSGGPVFGFRIDLRPIPFYQAGEYVFHFHGLPEEKMSVVVYAQGESPKDLPALAALETRLEGRLVDQDGHTLCHGTGVPRYNRKEHIQWVVEGERDVIVFWPNCMQMNLKPSVSYSLTLRVEDVDPQTPRINLVPVIEDAQLDLP
jgi:hypothetical protein